MRSQLNVLQPLGLTTSKSGVRLGGVLAVLIVVMAGCASSTITTTPTVSDISAATTETVEESRVDQALIALAATGVAVPNALHFALLADTLSEAPTASERAHLLTAAKRSGEQLWAQATAAAQSAQTPLDDRLLYWQRLLEKREFRKHCTAQDLCEQALHQFERASRGATNLQFETRANLRIIVSGFDPFSLDRHIDQSNPSGAAALALDGLQFNANGNTAEVQSVLFPVRFADFDDGMVEDIFEPFVRHPERNIDLLITLSMGRSSFDLERFPGRRRSATAPDNLRVRTGADSMSPTLPLLNGTPLTGPEFVEFSLPVVPMLQTQTPYPVNDNRNVATLEEGRIAATTLAQIAKQTAVSGSGGGYLSNEISYRTVRLVRLHNSDTAVGHLHTPRIEAFDPIAINSISEQIQAIIRAVVRATP